MHAYLSILGLTHGLSSVILDQVSFLVVSHYLNSKSTQVLLQTSQACV